MKLVILDRDGVINEDSVDHVKAESEWRALPGALEAIARLTQAGYRVVVATNQSGIGRGLFSIETLNRIHEEMLKQVAAAGGTIEAVFFCPCHPDDGCRCRKPQPGLLKQIAERLRTDLDNVPMVGDSARDLAAARAAGARPVLVRTGNGVTTERELQPGADVAVHDDLAAFVTATLAAAQTGGGAREDAPR